MNRLTKFIDLRQKGLRVGMAVQCAGLSGVLHTAWVVAVCLALIIVMMVAAVATANARTAASSQQLIHRLAQQTVITRGVSELFDQCLGDREGKLWINDQLHLCHATPTGIRRK